MGVERQIKKNQERLAFNEFTKQWDLEKRRRLAAQERGELKDDEKLLGRKPNFKQWKLMAEAAQKKMLDDLKKQLKERIAAREAEDKKLADSEWVEQKAE